MKKIFVTTIEIAVIAENDSDAHDAISIALSENLVQNNAILDWKYGKEKNHFIDKGDVPNIYEEGEAFI